MTDMEKSQYNELVSLLEGNIRKGIFANSSEILNELGNHGVLSSVITDLKSSILDLVLKEQETSIKIAMPDSEKVVWDYLMTCLTSSLLFVPSFIALIFFRPMSLALVLGFLAVFLTSFGVAFVYLLKMIRLAPVVRKDKLDYNARCEKLKNLQQECLEDRECLANIVHGLLIEG